MAQASTNPVILGSALEGAARRGVLGSLVETTKPGITKLVTVTALVGFGVGLLASGRAPATLADLMPVLLSALAVAVGTAMSAAGANALNQLAERDRDARMPRTRGRPLPEGRVTPGIVRTIGVLLCLGGVGLLWVSAGVPAALVSLACVVSYLLIYTPLKPLTPWATLTGTIPGGLPPLIGWAAVHQDVGFAALADWGGWSLVLLMVVWQMPHSLALAWMYKEDYRLGGYKLLPVVDGTGRRTAFNIAGWTVLLVPAVLLPWALLPGVVGPVYAAVALVSTLAFAWTGFTLVRVRDRVSARRVFLASIAHLPLILGVMVVEAAVRQLVLRA